MKRLFAIVVLVASFATALNAQILKPVKWEISHKKVSEGVYDII